MKKCFERINMVLIIITMVLVLTIFGNEAMKIQGSANAGNKTVANAQSVLSTNETKTTQIALGEYISLGRYNDKNIVWRCVSFDEKGYLMLAITY